MDRESYFRRFSKTIQPVAQAHDWMFQYHARPGITHHRLDLLAAVTLIAVDGAVRAGGFFRAEAATFQPHICIIQKPLTFPAQRRSRTTMMAPTMNFYHRLHCLPFPVQPCARESNGFGFRCGVGESIRSVLPSRYSHAIIVAYQSSEAFDAGQSLGQFMTWDKNHSSLTSIKSAVAPLGDNCLVRHKTSL